MRHSVDDAVSNGILTHISKMRLSETETEDFNKGFIYEKTKDILTKGHITVLATARVEKVLERAEFSQYLIPMNKFRFEKTVRVLSLLVKFLNIKTKGKFSEKTKKHEMKFNAFVLPEKVTSVLPSEYSDLASKFSLASQFKSMLPLLKSSDAFYGISFGCKDPNIKFVGKYHAELSDDDISWSLHYLFSKATEELKHFQKKEFLDKISIEKDGILMCRSRLLT